MNNLITPEEAEQIMKKKKALKKVVFEYEDGSKTVLVGDTLERWEAAVAGMSAWAFSHGDVGKEFESIWKDAIKE